VREVEFPGDHRVVMDFRRSGAVEAAAGQVDPAALAGEMANSIDNNKSCRRPICRATPRSCAWPMRRVRAGAAGCAVTEDASDGGTS
jgi:hypothetical protein